MIKPGTILLLKSGIKVNVKEYVSRGLYSGNRLDTFKLIQFTKDDIQSVLPKSGTISEKWNFKKKAKPKTDEEKKASVNKVVKQLNDAKNKVGKKTMKESRISPKNENNLMFEGYVKHLREDLEVDRGNSIDGMDEVGGSLQREPELQAWLQGKSAEELLDVLGGCESCEDLYMQVLDVLRDCCAGGASDTESDDSLIDDEDESPIVSKRAPVRRDLPDMRTTDDQDDVRSLERQDDY